MAGCFGNSYFDRCMESQLMKHLDEDSIVYCHHCKEEFNGEEEPYNEDDDTMVCPFCGKIIDFNL